MAKTNRNAKSTTPKAAVQDALRIALQAIEPWRIGDPDVFDTHISAKLRAIEYALRQCRPTDNKPIDVGFEPWGKLAWSGRMGRWRLVVIDDEECEDLLAMPWRCRMDACMAIYKLVERMKIFDE